MKSSQCPYCKEEIKADAMICKHCHERVYRSREEVVMAAISERIQIAAGAPIVKSNISAWDAFCHYKFAGDKAALDECLDIQKAAMFAAEVAARLQKELIVTFADIVWGGGDIDPLPLEKLVRERFSRPDIP